MYARRIQITNYGPIERLDIEFPFDAAGRPKPVLLVGENGSGKTLLLSHIVNVLVTAKSAAYPDSPEVRNGKVYKVRSNTYIKVGQSHYFAKVDFDNDLSVGEIRTRLRKNEYSEMPNGIAGTEAADLWSKMAPDRNEYYDSPLASHPLNPLAPVDQGVVDKLASMFTNQCALYFPSSRFEDPAWVNDDNVTPDIRYLSGRQYVGSTERRVIASSTFRENQNWLFHVLLDHFGQVLLGRQPDRGDDASAMFGAVGHVFATVLRRDDVLVGYGSRRGRALSLVGQDQTDIVPNVSQMSSGEAGLVTLFLSVLRDFDLSRAPFSGTKDVRGIVIVDEADLHLHVAHQRNVLPSLIALFPNIQFIVTTHSPLFVLGMSNVFGEDGFDLRRLPDGEQIGSEEFSEFGNAYQAFAETRRYAAEMRSAIERVSNPVVYLEGPTDVKYVKRAADVLQRTTVLDGIEIIAAGGEGKLKKFWAGALPSSADRDGQKVLFVADCDSQQGNQDKGRFLWRRITKVEANPVGKGIENLLAKETLEKAREHDPKFFAEVARVERELPDRRAIFDRWTVKGERKVDLCDWLCENGSAEDFQHFEAVLDLIQAALQDVTGGDP